MTDHLVPVDDDLSRRVFDRRILGESESKLAREFGLSTKKIRQLIDSHLPTLDREAARRALGLDLQRLDALFGVFFDKAMAGDAPSAAVCLKILERRGCYLGLDIAPVRSADPASAHVEPAPKESSTDVIQKALDFIANQSPHTIEGEVVDAAPEPPPEGSRH